VLFKLGMGLFYAAGGLCFLWTIVMIFK
jgi:hypothetical protein